MDAELAVLAFWLPVFIGFGLLVLAAFILILRIFVDVKKGLKDDIGGVNRPTLDWTYRGQTPSGFAVNYQVGWWVKRVNTAVYFIERPFREEVLQRLALECHEIVIAPSLKKASFGFRIGWRPEAGVGAADEFYPTMAVYTERDGDLYFKDVPMHDLFPSADPDLVAERGGCRFQMRAFHVLPLTNQLIEENYAMLNEEQKREIADDERYSAYEEQLVVALLKRRLDFLQGGARKYEANDFTIETEQAGRSLKIKWRLHAGAGGHYLWGFRNMGGFSNDQWNENANGVRVVDTYRDGEVVEVLQEGTSYFYTFFLKTFQDVAGQATKKSPLRFQTTIATKAETEEIVELLKKFTEPAKAEPEKEKLSRALKELGSYVEMDTAFDAMERSFTDQIEKSDHSEETKQLKIERLRDVIRAIRSDYEP